MDSRETMNESPLPTEETTSAYELVVVPWPKWPRSMEDVTPINQSLHTLQNKEEWLGRVVMVNSGKHRGECARVTGSGSGWVQIRFVLEDDSSENPPNMPRDPALFRDEATEVSKRAVDLQLCDIKGGVNTGDWKMAVMRRCNGAIFHGASFHAGEEDPQEIMDRQPVSPQDPAAAFGSGDSGMYAGPSTSNTRKSSTEAAGAAAGAGAPTQQQTDRRRSRITRQVALMDMEDDPTNGGDSSQEETGYVRRKSRRAHVWVDDDTRSGKRPRREDSLDEDFDGKTGRIQPQSRANNGSSLRPGVAVRGGNNNNNGGGAGMMSNGAQKNVTRQTLMNSRNGGITTIPASSFAPIGGGGFTGGGGGDDQASSSDEFGYDVPKQSKYSRRQRALRHARRRMASSQTGEARTALEKTRRIRQANMANYVMLARDRLEKAMGMVSRPNLVEWLERIQGSEEEEDLFVPLLFDIPFCPMCCLEKEQDSDLCWNPACWKSPVHYDGAPPLPGSVALPSIRHLDLAATLQSPRPAGKGSSSSTTATSTTITPPPSSTQGNNRFYAGRKRLEMSIAYSPLVTFSTRAPMHVLGDSPQDVMLDDVGYFGRGWRTDGVLFPPQGVTGDAWEERWNAWRIRGVQMENAMMMTTGSAVTTS